MSVIEFPKAKTHKDYKDEYFEGMHKNLDSILESGHLILYAKEGGIGVSTNLSTSETFFLVEQYKHNVLTQGTPDEDQQE
jgi:hypothetical protein